MRLMPGRAINSLAKTITNRRIQEIASHFISSSISNLNNYLPTAMTSPIGD
jgi:hypothetical protein